MDGENRRGHARVPDQRLTAHFKLEECGMGLKVISTHAEWDQIRDEFGNSSAYRDFSKGYSFDPSSRIPARARAVLRR